MINIDAFLNEYLRLLKYTFGSRLWFVGLQGSYARGEADENSDIDMVVVLDKLSVKDIEKYNKMLDAIPQRNLLCGFISGKDELLNWEPSDLFQFYYDTKPIIGTLDELLLLIDDNAVDNAVRIGACSIYHACVHNMLYEKSADILKSLYKSASFVVQAICFKETGIYFSNKSDLLSFLNNEDKMVIHYFLDLKCNKRVDFYIMSEALFNWSKRLINN